VEAKFEESNSKLQEAEKLIINQQKKIGETEYVLFIFICVIKRRIRIINPLNM
jgi:hypothetical protein